MSDKTFVDTNILIYAHYVDAKSKHEVASMLGERSGSPQAKSRGWRGIS